MGSLRRTQAQLRSVLSMRCIVDEAKLREAALRYDHSREQIELPVERKTADKAVGPEAGGPDACQPEQFWQEMFSALSMALPSLYAYLVCEAAANQTTAFRPGVYALVYSCWIHCGCSMAYHFDNALHLGLPGYDSMLTPTRLADLAGIHMCCVTFGFAVSHGAPLFTAILFVLNYACVRKLVVTHARGLPGAKGDGLRIGLCIMLYTSPMLLRGDFENYFGAIFFFLLSGSCYVANDRFNGWLHGVFHLLLVPYFHFLLRSAAGLSGDASFLI